MEEISSSQCIQGGNWQLWHLMISNHIDIQGKSPILQFSGSQGLDITMLRNNKYLMFFRSWEGPCSPTAIYVLAILQGMTEEPRISDSIKTSLSTLRQIIASTIDESFSKKCTMVDVQLQDFKVHACQSWRTPLDVQPHWECNEGFSFGRLTGVGKTDTCEGTHGCRAGYSSPFTLGPNITYMPKMHFRFSALHSMNRNDISIF